jgi:hypothetical protein
VISGNEAEAARYNAAERAKADELARKEKMMQEDRLLAPMEQKYGPGVRHIYQGDYSTPEASEALGNMAMGSDQSTFGFWQSDAARMDALLRRLGVNDPEQRRQMVEQHGYDGRGSWFFGPAEWAK